MEGLNISHLLFIVISFSLFSVSRSSQALGYLGCFKDDSERPLVDENGGRVLGRFKEHNDGILCKLFCETEHKRYAGTKRDFCICINTITNVPKSTSCAETCPGNKHEICGSITGASVYDTIREGDVTKITRPGRKTSRSISTTITTRAMTETSMHISHKKSTSDHAKETLNAKAYIGTTSHGDGTAESPGSTSTNNMNWNTGSNSDTPLTAVYIIIPVIVVGAVATTLIKVIILRRRRLKGATDECMHNASQGTAIMNTAFTGGTTVDTSKGNISNNYTESSNRRQYYELTCDDINITDTEYTTINQSSVEIPEGYHQYGHLKIRQGLVVGENKDYSHLVLNETIQNSKATDTLYSHTGTGMSQDAVTANGNEVDGTYNRLNATPLLNIDMTTDTVKDQDFVYDHALAGGNDPTVNDTEYSHLNGMKVKDQTTYSHCFNANSAFRSDNKSLDRGCEHSGDNSHTYFILEPEK